MQIELRTIFNRTSPVLWPEVRRRHRSCQRSRSPGWLSRERPETPSPTISLSQRLKQPQDSHSHHNSHRHLVYNGAAYYLSHKTTHNICCMTKALAMTPVAYNDTTRYRPTALNNCPPSGRQTVRRLWWMVFGVETWREVGGRGQIRKGFVEKQCFKSGVKELWRDSKGWGFDEFVGWVR